MWESESESNLSEEEQEHAPENFDSDDEVLGIKNDRDEHDSMESDIDRPQDDNDDIPDDRAWGGKKKNYYSADYVDRDYSTATHEDMQKAELEEQEARKIQQRLAEQLDDADFGLDLFQVSVEPEDEANHVEIVGRDLSKMSSKEKLALFHRENPEYKLLVDDYNDRLEEIKNILCPFVHLARKEKFADCPSIDFIKTKYSLTLNYCVNISFYLMLKGKKVATNSHPVMKRLAQYRTLLNQMEEKQGDLLNEALEILKAHQSNQSLSSILNKKVIQSHKTPMKSLEKKRKKPSVPVAKPEHDEEEEEKDDEDNELTKDENEKQEMPQDNEEEEEYDLGSKRAITYQIAKNKGLTPHRSKEQRNPRVKHRKKYRKATIRRRGAVREVRKELTRYDGEISGIKASVKKSIKLK